ncbi:MAG: formylglycine-generating enzyme family protein [Planctomycetes bacterium]|nr:formylglycine-generating enzyme family protein [Planctomycetota bacterium]
MSGKRKVAALGGLVALAAMAASWARQEAEAGGEAAPAAGKVPEGWEVLDGTAGASGFAKKARDRATGITFILVEPGTFQMGSPQEEVVEGEVFDDERPQHEVDISKPFYLGETEVTVRQWREFARKTKYRTDAEESGEGGWTVNAAGNGGELRKGAIWAKPIPLHEYEFSDLHPVTQVSWNDAQAFCKEFGCRLPSEAEWEYACRAGTSTAYWWGDEESGGEGKGNFADQAAKRKFHFGGIVFSFDDGHVFTAPVGTYAANAWGFRDMLGNVWEWCADVYDERYYGRSQKLDPVNAGRAGGGARSLRGGAWCSNPRDCRSAFRLWYAPDGRYDGIGFRLARTP